LACHGRAQQFYFSQDYNQQREALARYLKRQLQVEGDRPALGNQTKSQTLVSGLYYQDCPRRADNLFHNASGQTRPELRYTNSKIETSGAPVDLLELDPEWLKIAEEDSAVMI
jgi:hypothetical protein